MCGPTLPCVQTVCEEARPNIIPIHTNGARKGPTQYPVRGQTKVRGQPFEEWTKLPSEERCSMLARSGDCVRGLWSPRHFCPRCLVNLLITRNNAQDNLITSQRGKYPTKSSGRKWQISSDAVTSALNVPQLTFWPH